MSEGGATKRTSIWKKLGYASVTTCGLAATVFLLGEFAVRWYVLGGARPALTSFVASQKVFVPDPDLGFKINPEASGVNSLGIRHGEISLAKPPHSYRILVLGDSVAFEATGFVGILGEELSESHRGQVEVINAAIPGFTTFQELVFLKRDLVELRPDLVILQYCLNDNYKFLHYIDDSGRWLLTPEAERASGLHGTGPLASWMRRSHLIVTIRVGLAHLGTLTGAPFVWDERPDFYAAWDDSSWSTNESYLTEMKALLDAAGAMFMVVVVPFEPQLSTRALEKDREYTLKPQRHLKDIFTRLDAPILDLFPVFFEHREERLYRDAIHLTERGHRIVADELVTFLRDNGLIATQFSRE